MPLPIPSDGLESPSTVELLCLPPEEVHKAWPLLEPILARVVSLTPKLELEDVLALTQSGDFQLWVMWDSAQRETLAVFTTELAPYPSGWKTVRINLLAGQEMERWTRILISGIEQWAIAEGCDAVELVGRRGWGRVYPDYELIEHTFSKDLKELRHGQRWKQ